MLDLAGIPLRSRDRDGGFPVVCAGGPCAYNPEPMAEFIDFFYIGDGEMTLDMVLDKYIENKKRGGSINAAAAFAVSPHLSFRADINWRRRPLFA
jgi:radical SAM superfamily enzyme YgiQ (UPF0313 family)